MADYYSPTVVEPELPDCDMTPLERLVLGHIFDVEPAREGHSYFFSENGPSDILSFEADELRQVYEASRNLANVLTEHVGELLARHDAIPEDQPAFVDIDVTNPAISWERILQAIARRSTTIDEIVVTVSWTCSKMRSDGFGGGITRITADKIQYSCTSSMLENLRNEGMAEAFQIVLDLAKQNVIAENDLPDQSKRQLTAIAMIEDFAVNEYGDL